MDPKDLNFQPKIGEIEIDQIIRDFDLIIQDLDGGIRPSSLCKEPPFSVHGEGPKACGSLFPLDRGKSYLKKIIFRQLQTVGSVPQHSSPHKPPLRIWKKKVQSSHLSDSLASSSSPPVLNLGRRVPQASSASPSVSGHSAHCIDFESTKHFCWLARTRGNFLHNPREKVVGDLAGYKIQAPQNLVRQICVGMRFFYDKKGFSIKEGQRRGLEQR